MLNVIPRFRTSLPMAFVLLLSPSAAYAQAAITGVVRDASGGVLPGVTVGASSPALIEKVRSVVTDLAMSGRLTPEMARNLLDVQYCKTKFRLGWPFLKKVNPLIALSQQMKDDKGYARFWKAPLTIGSEQYLVCNQWFEWQRDRFEAWVRELGLTSGRHTPR